MRFVTLLGVALLPLWLWAQPPCTFRLAKLKYEGGGDWYSNPSALPNLLGFLRAKTNTAVCPDEEVVEPGSAQLFQYPFVYLTGHGNVVFSPQEVENLRTYLQAGGFLLMDDNYGLHSYAKREIAKLFPDVPLREIPWDHPIYRQAFRFERGIPKIHEHDGKPAQAFGIELEGRLVLVLTYEADLSDGWEDPEVHHDPEAIRQQALQMGANLVLYAIGGHTTQAN
ncbi:MAG: DUF4159 domain-containing protein [Bacteroidia bacterium]|nr:DUF4159 domain-containing protein [Bacteroidia bacterium]